MADRKKAPWEQQPSGRKKAPWETAKPAPGDARLTGQGPVEGFTSGLEKLGSDISDLGSNIYTGISKGVSNAAALPIMGAELLNESELGMVGVDPETGRSTFGAHYDPVTGRRLTAQEWADYQAAKQAVGMPKGPTFEAASQVRSGVQGALDPTPYVPETGAGRVVQTAAEFAVPFGAARRGVVAMGAGAGGAYQGLIEADLPEWAPAAAVITPFIMATFRAAGGAIFPKRAERMVQDAISADRITMDEIRAGYALMRTSHEQGVPLTIGRAIAQVTNGRAMSLAKLENVAEGSRGGGGIMAENLTTVERGLDPAQRAVAGQIAGQPGPMTIPLATESVWQELTGPAGQAMRTAAQGQNVDPAYMTRFISRIENQIATAPADVAAQLRRLRDDLIAMPAQPGHTPAMQAVTGQPGRAPTAMTPITDMAMLDDRLRIWRDKAAPPRSGGAAVPVDPEAAALQKIIRTNIIPLTRELRQEMARTNQPYARALTDFEHGATAAEVIDTIRNGFDEAALTNQWRSGSFLDAVSRRQWEQMQEAVAGLPRGQQRLNALRTFMSIIQAHGRRLARDVQIGDFGGTQRELGRGRIPIPTRAFTKAQVWIDDTVRGFNTRDLARLAVDPRYERRMIGLLRAPVNRRNDLALALINDVVALNARSQEGRLTASADARARAEQRQ